VRRTIKCPHCGKPIPLPSERRNPSVAYDSTKRLRVGDLVLNPDTYDVSRAGKEITLSRTLFQLLESLMQHSGRVVSRNMLVHSVWDSDSDVDNNLINVSIFQLRKKVDRNHKVKLIKTIRDLGYSIRSSGLDS
jgi:DNA-binding response OmpR family regulator